MRHKGRLTVDSGVNPFVQLIDFLPDLGVFRIEVNGCLIFRKLIVERSVENPDDFGGLVIHDGMRLLVPQYGNSEPSPA